jgi:uncharacterized membrane protein YedE/YeeE
MASLPVNVLVSLLGLLAGIVFGAAAQRTNFCTMGALSDIVNLQDYRRFRAWMLAIAVATAGSQALYLTGTVDLGKSIYLTANLGWLGAIIGGLMFGFGMTLTGGCGNKTLVRLGAGNLKSLVVGLVLGVFAFMTLRGLIGVARLNFIESTNANLAGAGLSTQGIADLLSAGTGLSLPGLRWVVAVGTVLGLLWYCFKDAEFRASPANIIGGSVIGALIPVGWIITGIVGADDFDPVPLASFTFVAPIGEALMYLMVFTGASINFGIAAIGGVVLGSFMMAIATRTFRIEAFNDRNDMLRHLAGGALMGTGGVLALGCTIGQGITGISTLALGSLIALLSIVAGGLYGLKYLEEGSLGGAFRAIVARG